MMYDYECKSCGLRQLDIYNRIDDRKKNAPVCCDKAMEIVILTAPYGFVDNMEEYMCPVTMQGVTTRRQRNEIMAREKLIDANDFMKTPEQRKAQVEKVEDDRKMIAKEQEKLAKAGVIDQVDSWAKKELDLA